MRALRGEPLILVGNGEQKDSFCYVDDMLDGLIAYMNSDIAFGPIEFGYPEPISIFNLAKLVTKTLRSNSNIIFNGIQRPAEGLASKMNRPIPNIVEAREKLNWNPAIKLEEGISKLAKYYREQT